MTDVFDFIVLIPLRIRSIFTTTTHTRKRGSRKGVLIPLRIRSIFTQEEITDIRECTFGVLIPLRIRSIFTHWYASHKQSASYFES